MTGLDDSIFANEGDSSTHRPGAGSTEWTEWTELTRAERRRARRDGSRRAARRGRGCRRRGVSCLTLLLGGVVVLAAAWFAVGSLASLASLGSLIPGFEDNDYSGPGHGEVEVVIDSGASGSQIGATLQQADVVKTTSSFTEVARAQPDQASSIQPGTYTMRKQMAARDAFDRLLSPDSRVAQGVTIREGLWRSEIYTKLSEGTGTPVTEYEKAEDSRALELPAEAEGRVEGWLFPSTYDFAEDASAVDQMNTMIEQTVARLRESGVPQEDWERTLTVASIVEGESGAADRRKVARVVENRLADPDGPTRGMLQMDSTIHYLLQKRGTITTSDKDRNTDSPYNTYKNVGLPPGPINNPGAAAIEAAGDPAEGDWLFFVTVDPSTGETKFAETQAEHERNVQEFCTNTGSCEGP